MTTLACNICEWNSTEEPPLDMSEGTWHVYEQHPEVWLMIFGDRPPKEPDIRTPEGRAEFLASLTGMGQN